MIGFVELNVDIYSLPFSLIFLWDISLQNTEKLLKIDVRNTISKLWKISKNIHYLLSFLILELISIFWCQRCVEIVYWCLFPYFHNILRCLRSKTNAREILVFYVIHKKVEWKLSKTFTHILTMQLFSKLI